MAVSVQSILRGHFGAYARRQRLPLHWHQAARALMDCRSEALGGFLEGCSDHPDETQPIYFGCKHRACPRCAGKAKAEWLEQQRHKLLDGPHAHVIFTLPHELLDLWRYNRSLGIDLQFRAAQETLHTLLVDPRYLGATPGFLLALHTHGRDLSLHPHLHGLVTCGGVDTSERWRDLPRSILLPARVVRSLYRGKVLAFLTEALDAGTLALPPRATPEAVRRLLQELYRKTWNVRIERRYRQGRGVVVYLARYVQGGPLSDRRLVRADADAVSFRYTSHRDGQERVMTLAPERFLERLFAHLPEPGKPTVRYYGLYSPRQAARLKALRRQRGETPTPCPEPTPATLRTCPICATPLVQVGRLGRSGLNFLYKESRTASGASGLTGSAPRVCPTRRSREPAPVSSVQRWGKPEGPSSFFCPERGSLN